MDRAGDRPLRFAIAAGGLLLAAVAIARQGEVIARGNLLPVFEAYEVTRVRILGFELYVDFSTDAGDVLTAAALGFAAALLLRAAGRLAGRPGRALRRAGWGALFLAADDLLSVHETIGHNLLALARIPVVDHPDDVVLAVYAAVVLAFAWRERELLRGASARPWWIAAGAAALAVAHDVSPLHARALEEGLEVVAAISALVGVDMLTRSHLRRAEAGSEPSTAEQLRDSAALEPGRGLSWRR